MEKHIKDAMNNAVLKLAQEKYEYQIDDLVDLNGFENFVYGFGDFVIRFVHSKHRSYKMVLAEIEFIDYLSKNGASVSTIVHSKDGNIAEKFLLDNGDYFTVVVFTRAPGTFLKKDDMNEGLFFNLGREIGKLHKLSKDYVPENKRYTWDEEDYIGQFRKYLDDEDDFILIKATEIFNKIKSIPITKENYGLIHTDLHFGNMYIENNKLTFFDFDDSSYKYYISDIAIVLYYYFSFTNREADRCIKSKEILVPFMKGYNQYNNIEKEMFSMLNDFLKLRETILYLAVKADDHGETDNPGIKALLAYLRNNIVNEIPFFTDLESIIKNI